MRFLVIKGDVPVLLLIVFLQGCLLQILPRAEISDNCLVRNQFIFKPSLEFDDMFLDSKASLTNDELTDTAFIEEIRARTLPPTNILWHSSPFFWRRLVTGDLIKTVAGIALFIRRTHYFAALEWVSMTRCLVSFGKLEIFIHHVF